MLEKVSKIFQDYKDNEDLIVTEDTTFEELELDSLDTVELLMNVEEEFDISIEMDESVKTVGDLIKLIESAG